MQIAQTFGRQKWDLPIMVLLTQVYGHELSFTIDLEEDVLVE